MLVLLFAERLLADSSARELLLSFAGLSASFGAFLVVAPADGLSVSLVFGPCFVVWAMWMKRLRGLLIIGCAMGVGSTIAAAYFLPAVAEQNLVNYDDVERTWPYHASYVMTSRRRSTITPMTHSSYAGSCIWAFNALAISGSAGILACLFWSKSVGGIAQARMPALPGYGCGPGPD